MFYSTKNKLIASFFSVSLLVGVVALMVGGQMVYRFIRDDAKSRVRLNLNVADEIYRGQIKMIEVSVNITTLGYGFIYALERQEVEDLVLRLDRLARYAELDFAGIVTPDGETLCRIGPNPIPPKDFQQDNPIAELALMKQASVSGAVALSREFLLFENKELARRSRIPIINFSVTEETDAQEESAGMALAAAAPVLGKEALIGVIYGGILLDQENKVIRKIHDTVFVNETYKGRPSGVVTLFYKDIRIATNLVMQNGIQAVGSRVGSEVGSQVLGNGEIWNQNVQIMNQLYFSAYKPINDIFGNRIGMLSIGSLEEKYLDISRKSILVLLLITVAGMVLAVGLGYFLGSKIMIPVYRLIKASQQVKEGSLTPDIGPIAKGEIGILQANFKEMVKAMGRRRTESQNRLVQSEKHASIGRLAAGVAHEINNPLSGVLTFTQLLLRRKDLDAEMRIDLQTISDATERVRSIVKGLLDFSRQTMIKPEPTDINKLILSSIALIENQALIKGVGIKNELAAELPTLTVDKNQLESALLNIMINALDATETGGAITVATGISWDEKEQEGVSIYISDNGGGISSEHLPRIFEPFYTTKRVGQGTGLGLAVSLGILQRHSGNISVQSEPGKGSIFTVWLPMDEE